MIQSCTRCLVNSNVDGSVFYKNGECNYCSDFLNKIGELDKIDKFERSLEKLLVDIKKNKKSKYDSIVGVSGGVDSSWVAVKAKQSGLNPLLVHMDNGWNSELAQNNIENLIINLDLDLYTYVIDWKEYKELMLAFLDADVIDVELLYDNAVHGVLYRIAKKFKIKYILMGTNLSTEGMVMPENWSWHKWDNTNIKSIGKKFRKVKIKSYPLFGIIDYFFMKHIYKIKSVSYLDYFKYDKNIALGELESRYMYKPYPYKHYESIFTRFYQGFLLPNKFDVDKRIFHLSNLVLTNQMTIEDAQHKIKQSPYSDKYELQNDIDYFLKKLDWTYFDLDSYLNRPPVSHDTYKSNVMLWKFLKKIYAKYDKYNFVKFLFKGKEHLYR